MDSPLRVGVLGLGGMGGPMAHRLVRAGFVVSVFDPRLEAMASLVEAGAVRSTGPAEVAQQSDIIVASLPSAPVVDEVIGEIIASYRDGSVRVRYFVDTSTSYPAASRKAATDLATVGIAMLDAPVSGGEPGAIAGTLAIMAGGKQEVFERCKEILNVMGKSVVRVGNIGAGGFAKLANQIIVALNIAAISEAFTLASKADIDPEILFQAIRGGLAGSNVMDSKVPMIIERNFEPGFKIKLHYKDIKNVMNTARDLNVPLPLTSIIQQMLATLILDNKGELDHGAIVNFEEKLAKIEVSKPK